MTSAGRCLTAERTSGGLPLTVSYVLATNCLGRLRRARPEGRQPGVLDSDVDTPELAALVPGFMSGHPGHDWTLVSGNTTGEDLLMHLHPVASPERVATVQVNAGAEVFCFTFAEHVGTAFAYEDADRAEALKERIDLAAAATLGPTRVVLDRCGDLTVGSSLVVDPDGVSPREDTVVSWPLRRLKARLRGGRTTRQVIEFPPV